MWSDLFWPEVVKHHVLVTALARFKAAEADPILGLPELHGPVRLAYQPVEGGPAGAEGDPDSACQMKSSKVSGSLRWLRNSELDLDLPQYPIGEAHCFLANLYALVDDAELVPA